MVGMKSPPALSNTVFSCCITKCLVPCLRSERWIPNVAQVTQVSQEHGFTCSVKCHHPCTSDERKCTSCTSLMLNHSSCKSVFVIRAFKAVIAYKLFLETNSLFLEGQRKCISKPFDSLIFRIQKHTLSITEYKATITECKAKNHNVSEAQIWAKVEMIEIAALCIFSPLALSPNAALNRNV